MTSQIHQRIVRLETRRRPVVAYVAKLARDAAYWEASATGWGNAPLPTEPNRLAAVLAGMRADT
ncbi:hypothetical protein [Bosea sp. PAMC 26642]|uniref:hypothetical protein n=1 Tax=Bosea sp. (strain PAMC 26642) TaxID=1792307 RepID=UPI00077044EF|nr:hypothetical protein [Bosea sp. PAMC 26642]AMJ61982.1 hypothetical protein AXW83_18250 [Bosea sp. PAMC 26642]